MAEGKIAAPADGKVSWTSHDLAAAAAAILTGVKTFDGPTPPLTGCEALDLPDLAFVASTIISIPIIHEVLSDTNFRAKAKERGLSEGYVQVSLGYYEASRRGEFEKIDPTLEQLTGRLPRTMQDVLREAAQKKG